MDRIVSVTSLYRSRHQCPAIKLLAYFKKVFTKSPTGYFTHQSPDFINYKGQPLNAAQQVEALALAQSIGA